MIFALCFSPNWAQYIDVQLHALLKNNPGSHTIHLVSDELPTATIEQYQNICAHYGCTLHFHNLSFSPKYKVTNRFTKYTLYRLALPDLIQEDRVLYLDSDTLVLGDISPLFNLDLGNNWIAGAIDTGIKVPHKVRLGIGSKGTYVNAGVLLISMDKVRHLGWLRLGRDRRFTIGDQDIINKTCRGHILPISNIYNASLSTGFPPEQDIRILHYAGVKSPWVENLPLAHIWKKYEDDTRKLQDSP